LMEKLLVLEYLETGLQPLVSAWLGGVGTFSPPSSPIITVRWSLDGLPSDELQGHPRPMPLFMGKMWK